MIARLLPGMLLIASCSTAPEESPQLSRSGIVQTQSLREKVATLKQRQAQDKRRALAACKSKHAHLRDKPGLVGTPTLDQQRAHIVARAKGEPVIFIRPPSYAPSDSAVVQAYRRALLRARFPWDLVKDLVKRFAASPKLARKVLLREGYLYAETADLAWSLAHFVALENLFDEDELVIERGSETISVIRRDGLYRVAAGTNQGQKAKLLLFDRVRPSGENFGPPLHRDLRQLKHQLGFDQVRILKIHNQSLVAKFRYGEFWQDVVLKSTGARVELDCEVLSASHDDRLISARQRTRQRARLMAVVRREILAQVDEKLPFDEPRTEWGQQDGHLRRYWKKAYENGQTHYTFNYDSYAVFTAKGAPKPPQVCIDFITETFERASGTWWQPLGQARKRRLGAFDYDQEVEGSRRQVPVFINYAQKHPEQFEVEVLSPKARIPYLFKRAFYNRLERHADDFRVGDIVVIRGLAPWDHYAVPHFHTFFVYETDPVTSMPILLAGNAGRPKIQDWEAVMSRSPQRKIEFRVRPRKQWLEQIIDGRQVPLPDRAFPLVAVN